MLQFLPRESLLASSDLCLCKNHTYSLKMLYGEEYYYKEYQLGSTPIPSIARNRNSTWVGAVSLLYRIPNLHLITCTYCPIVLLFYLVGCTFHFVLLKRHLKVVFHSILFSVCILFIRVLSIRTLFSFIYFFSFLRIIKSNFDKNNSQLYICMSSSSEVSMQLKNLSKNINKNKCREVEIDTVFKSPCLFTSNALIQFA